MLRSVLPTSEDENRADVVDVGQCRPGPGPTLSRNCKAEQEFGIAAAFAGVTIPDGERGFAGRPNEATQIADRI
jgi:hypothetical protein